MGVYIRSRINKRADDGYPAACRSLIKSGVRTVIERIDSNASRKNLLDLREIGRLGGFVERKVYPVLVHIRSNPQRYWVLGCALHRGNSWVHLPV